MERCDFLICMDKSMTHLCSIIVAFGPGMVINLILIAFQSTVRNPSVKYEQIETHMCVQPTECIAWSVTKTE